MNSFRDSLFRASFMVGDRTIVDSRIRATTFEVNQLRGFFGRDNGADGEPFIDNKQGDDPFNFCGTTPIGKWSNGHVGMVSWDDANADGSKTDNEPCTAGLRNVMEFRGTVNLVPPAGQAGGPPSFTISQEKRGTVWRKDDQGANWDR